MKTSDPPIQVKHHFEQPVAKVWKAITELDQMTVWFFDNIPDFEAKVGFKTRFVVTSEDRTFIHLWDIVEVIPLKKIRYRWRYEDYQGDSFVTFELSEVKNQTILTLTTTIVEDFPEDIPEFKRESCQAGWNYFIKESLKNYLDVE